MSSPSAKRARISSGVDEEEVPADLLELYESDIGSHILSYASVSDLCILDALCKRFQQLTTTSWSEIANARFGMTNGKEGWKTCLALLREPVFSSPTDDQDHGYGDLYAGSARAAANRSIVVMVADDVNGNTYSRTFPDERDGMGIRDAFTLNYIRTVPSPIYNWQVAICGRVGSEIIVTTNCIQVCARRGDDVQVWQYGQLRRGGNGIPVLGCETHIIVAVGSDLEIYAVNPAQVVGSARGGDLVSLCQTVKTKNAGDDEAIEFISWNSDKSHLITCFPHKICVWKFDAESSNAILVQTIITDSETTINCVALAKDYVVGASKDKKLHIWCRTSGVLLHTDLCDVDQDDELDEDEIIYPISMSCHGNILVSTSHIGCALCVWDLKTGRVLKRHNDAEDERHADMLPDGVDVSSMVHLECLNAFLCMTGTMNVWAFPTNKRQNDMVRSIRRREERISRALYTM